MAEIAWAGGAAVLESARMGVGNDAIVAAAGRVSLVGIDCPVGWPVAFTDLLIAARLGTVLADVGADDAARRRLAFRLTDQLVRAETGQWPLSVSADRIAYPAMRCAGLLARMSQAGMPVRRSGIDSRIAEVYPAAALRIWKLPKAGYKTDRAVRIALVEAIAVRSPWLDWRDFQPSCIETADVLDAVICALVAGALLLGWTGSPAPDQVAIAEEEGWIHLPDAGFLRRPWG